MALSLLGLGLNALSVIIVVVNAQADAQRVDAKRSKSRRWFPAKRQRNAGDQLRPPQPYPLP